MSKNHKKAKKPKLTADETKIVQQVNALIRPFECRVTGIGPEAVGVLGDARSVGVAIIVKFAPTANITEISTLIINRVRGIARVLMELP